MLRYNLINFDNIFMELILMMVLMWFCDVFMIKLCYFDAGFNENFKEFWVCYVQIVH